MMQRLHLYVISLLFFVSGGLVCAQNSMRLEYDVWNLKISPQGIALERIDVPSFDGLTCSFKVSGLMPTSYYGALDSSKPIVSIRRAGTRNGQPVALLEIHPIFEVEGVYRKYQHITVDVSWNAVPIVEQKDVSVQANSWYDPQAPYAKIKTARDGVAFVTGGEVFIAQPKLKDISKDELALFWHGEQQHIAVIDVDANNLFSEPDTILFQGRRPQGDSTYYSMFDTTAQFFLTRKIPVEIENSRFDYIEGVTNTTELNELKLEQHIEFDTGYYHIGSANNVALADFNSDYVFLEGFYWQRLNANVFQKNTFRHMLTPASGGSATYTAHYISSANVLSMSPDTRADLVLNGSKQAFLESDGIDRYSITCSATRSNLVSGLQSLRLYATGIDSLRSDRNYFSDMMLDYYEVKADVLPVLDSGRLNAIIPATQENVSVTFKNAHSVGYVIDTTNHQWTRLVGGVKGRVIRYGLCDRDRNWTTDAVPTDSWRATTAIDDDAINVDSVAGIYIAYKMSDNSPLEYQTFNNGDDAAALVNQLNPLAAYVIVNCGVPTTQALIDALNDLGIGFTAKKYWIVAGVVGVETYVSNGDVSPKYTGTFVSQYDEGSRRETSASFRSGDARTIFVADAYGIEHARVEQAHLRHLTSNTEQTGVLFITYKAHREQAERLAEHRRRHDGVSVRVVDVDEILDEFGYGDRNVEALRQYIAHVYNSVQPPSLKYVVLFGAASWDMRLAVKEGNVGARMPDQVPSYGRPSSDYYLSMLDDVHDYGVPEVIVGRLPAVTEQDGKTIVDKIIATDTMQYDTWMRRWLFVGGGTEPEGFCDIYGNMLDDPSGSGITFTDPPLSLDTATVCRYTVPSDPGFYIKQEINKGVAWMNYIGHGAPEQFDILGWDPKELANTNKYGVLATYSCQTGSFSNPSKPCKNAQYLLEPNKGFSAAMGSTGYEFLAFVDLLHYNIHFTLRDTTVNIMFRRLGDVLYQSKVDIGTNPGAESRNTVMQFCLLGDPMQRVRIDTIVEPFIRNQDVSIANTQGVRDMTDADSVAIVTVNVQNRGLGTEKQFAASAVWTNESNEQEIEETLYGINVSSTIQFRLNIKNKPGIHRVRIDVDADQVFADVDEDNVIDTTFSVLPQALLPIEPVPNGFIDRNNVHVRVIDPTTRPSTVRFAISRAKSLDIDNVLALSNETETARTGSVLDWETQLSTSLPLGDAWVAAYLIFDDTQQPSSILWLPVTITGSTNEPVARHSGIELTTPTPDSVYYDSVNQAYQIKSYLKNIYIRSNGIPRDDEDKVHPLEFRIGNVIHQNNRFLRGINLMIVNDTDTTTPKLRWYTTGADPQPPGSGQNGFTSELINFLRDSVASNERVCFAACKESFAGFDDANNKDSLIAILKEYGSGFADQLDTNSSWAMIGVRGTPVGMAPELHEAKPDSIVTLNDSIPFFAHQGIVESGWIGPARRWDSVFVVQSPTGAKTVVIGQFSDGTVREIEQLEDSNKWVPVANDTAQEQPLYVKMQWTISYEGTEVLVKGADAYFIPANEWIIEPSGVVVTADTVLRGDSVSVNIAVRNAQRKLVSDSTTINVELEASTGGSAYTATALIPFIPADSTINVSVSLPTETLGTESKLNVNVDEPRKQNEFYVFNNRRSSVVYLREDTIPPTIKAFADGIDVSGGGEVFVNAYLSVRLYDNSNLSIVDSNRVVVFVNGDRIKPTNTTNYEWYPTQECAERFGNTGVKAALEFSYPLEQGQNNLIVRANDATGNNAELETALWTTDEEAIIRVVTAPNPSTGVVTFTITARLKGPELYAGVLIYDINGKLVKTLNEGISDGTFTVVWDGTSAEGTSVPTGVYYYRISAGEWMSGSISTSTGYLQILR